VRSWAFQIAVAAVCDDDGHVCEALWDKFRDISNVEDIWADDSLEIVSEKAPGSVVELWDRTAWITGMEMEIIG
jgi:hypothetical protein